MHKIVKKKNGTYVCFWGGLYFGVVDQAMKVTAGSAKLSSARYRNMSNIFVKQNYAYADFLWAVIHLGLSIRLWVTAGSDKFSSPRYTLVDDRWVNVSTGNKS